MDSLEDRLVYYTLAAVHSKKLKVKIAAASLMFTHLHQSAMAGSREILTRYLRNTDSAFTRLYNHRYSRTASQLFDRPVGLSQKSSFKDRKTNLIYVFNNHVEKGLCREAVQERWSFLAYAFSDHPFSPPIDIKSISKTLLKAIRLVDRRVAKGRGLEYEDLDKVIPVLGPVELEQFVDYVISHYAWIDFSMGTSLFGTLSDMVLAVNSTTGSEYEIEEEFSRLKDTEYVSLVQFARDNSFLERIHSMTGEEKMRWIVTARNQLFISYEHLRKFFHYDFEVSRNTF